MFKSWEEVPVGLVFKEPAGQYIFLGKEGLKCLLTPDKNVPLRELCTVNQVLEDWIDDKKTLRSSLDNVD